MKNKRAFLKAILGVILVAITLPTILGIFAEYYIKRDELVQFIGKYGTYLIIIIFLPVLFYYLFLTFKRWNQKRTTFWKNIDAQEKIIIDNYLKEIYIVNIKDNANELNPGYDLRRTYVGLSGVIPPQAEIKMGASQFCKNTQRMINIRITL